MANIRRWVNLAPIKYKGHLIGIRKRTIPSRYFSPTIEYDVFIDDIFVMMLADTNKNIVIETAKDFISRRN